MYDLSIYYALERVELRCVYAAVVTSGGALHSARGPEVCHMFHEYPPF